MIKVLIQAAAAQNEREAAALGRGLGPVLVQPVAVATTAVHPVPDRAAASGLLDPPD